MPRGSEERLARPAFNPRRCAFFATVNIPFFPMHFLGLSGMPRRYPDYPGAFVGWNFVVSMGAFISGLSVLIFFYGLFRTFMSGEAAPSRPRGEDATLEWTLPSPPPHHAFEELPMIVE
jgi:cytochrome c oxidase subunit I